MDMTLNKYRNITSTCWDKNCQPLTIDMTRDKNTGRYKIGLGSLFVPETNAS